MNLWGRKCSPRPTPPPSWLLLSKETLQVAEKRSERQGERKRYTQPNPGFQRIARRDKKSFLNEQCKDIKENNRMGKTRDLFKRIGDIKGAFHARMDMIKDRHSKDLIEAEEVKKRWQEYTEELCKQSLTNPGNHEDVVTHLKPDILECEVKWALGSITTKKASGGDGNSS